jgi:hypothetical protein
MEELRCSKCGNEIEEGARFCPKCGKEINNNKSERTNVMEIINKIKEEEDVYSKCGKEKNNNKPEKINLIEIINKIKEIISKCKFKKLLICFIIIILLIIISIAMKFYNNQESTIENNEASYVSENKTIKFQSTKDLEEYSQTVTLSSGEKWTVTGLELIFSDALKYKASNVKTSKGNSLYSEMLASYGNSEIKGFIINEDVIGGYIVYFTKENGYLSKSGMCSSAGYYINNQEIAIKITNWEGLNNLRNF